MAITECLLSLIIPSPLSNHTFICLKPRSALAQHALAVCSPAASWSLSHPYKLVFSITPNKSLQLFDAHSFNNKHLNRELNDQSPALGRLLWLLLGLTDPTHPSPNTRVTFPKRDSDHLTLCSDVCC